MKIIVTSIVITVFLLMQLVSFINGAMSTYGCNSRKNFEFTRNKHIIFPGEVLGCRFNRWLDKPIKE